MINKRIFFFWIILSSLYVFNSPLPAQTNFKEAMGKMKFEISVPLDSLYIDGSRVPLPSTNMISVSADSHQVVAYLGNHTPISMGVKVKKYHIQTVELQFPGNIGRFAGRFGIVAGQHFESWMENPNFNTRSNYNKILLGVSARSWGSYTTEIKEDFNEPFQTSSAIIRVQKKLKKSVSISPNNSFLSSLSFNLAYQRLLYKKLHLRLFASYYPKLTTQVKLYDVLPYASDYGEPTYVAEYESSLYLGGLDFVFASYSRSSFNLYFSFGGFMSNSVSKNLELEISNPYIYTFTEPLVTDLDYSYSASGFSAGVMTDFQFSEHGSLCLIYKAYFTQLFKVDKKSERNLLSDISANLVFSF